jgi:hypothetical protein
MSKIIKHETMKIDTNQINEVTASKIKNKQVSKLQLYLVFNNSVNSR